MNKSKVILISIILLVAVGFCGCNLDEYKPVTYADKSAEESITVYIYGAVENEGYYTIPLGTDYKGAIVLAGLLPQSIVPANGSSVVLKTVTEIAVRYSVEGEVRDCVNVNGMYVLMGEVEGVPAEVTAKLSAYINENGKIHNKATVREVLGEEDFLKYGFVFTVFAADYEKAD